MNNQNIDLLVSVPSDLYPDSWTLTSRIGEILDLAQAQFGQMRNDFIFLGIEFKSDGPRIQFQNDNKENLRYVRIQLTPDVLKNEYHAYYQLAHEVYHLLAPTGKFDANVLEEGLATYFSKVYLDRFQQSMFDWEANTRPYPNYYVAYELVEQLQQINPDIIKIMRDKFPHIQTSYFTIDHFKEVMGKDTPYELLNQLLQPFKY